MTMGSCNDQLNEEEQEVTGVTKIHYDPKMRERSRIALEPRCGMMTLHEGITDNKDRVDCGACLNLIRLDEAAEREKGNIEMRAAHDHVHVKIDSDEQPVLRIVECARCGEYHRNLVMKPFTLPVSCACGVRFDFYCTCPETGEPLLVETEVS